MYLAPGAKNARDLGRPLPRRVARSARPTASTEATHRDSRSAPEDARSSCGRSGREFPGKCRLADPWFTGNQHDLSASVERVVERTAQLR